MRHERKRTSTAVEINDIIDDPETGAWLDEDFLMKIKHVGEEIHLALVIDCPAA